MITRKLLVNLVFLLRRSKQIESHLESLLLMWPHFVTLQFSSFYSQITQFRKPLVCSPDSIWQEMCVAHFGPNLILSNSCPREAKETNFLLCLSLTLFLCSKLLSFAPGFCCFSWLLRATSNLDQSRGEESPGRCWDKNFVLNFFNKNA